jgi:hypothetical protein
MYQVHSKESAPEASRATMEAMEKKYGFVPNLIGVLAESPAAVQAYAAIAAALEHSALSAVEQQVVTLTVSAANDCAYCVGSPFHGRENGPHAGRCARRVTGSTTPVRQEARGAPHTSPVRPPSSRLGPGG